MSSTDPQLNSTPGVSYLYMAAAFVIVVFGLRMAESIVNPLLLAIFLAVISAPAYFGLMKKNVPNWLALLIVIGVLSAMMLGVVYVMMGSIASFTSRQQHYRELLSERTSGLQAQARQWVPDWWQKADAEPDPLPKESGDPSRMPSVAEENSVNRTSGPESSVAPPDAKSPSAVLPESSPAAAPNGAAAGDHPAMAAAIVDPAAVDPDDVDSTAVDDPEAVASTTDAPDAAADGNTSEPESVVPPSDSSFGFPQTRTLPRDDKTWRKLLMEQFDLGNAISLAGTVLGSIGQLLGNAFLILLTVVFILLEAGTFGNKIKDAFVRTDETAQRAQQIIDSIQHYIVIKTWISLATGIFVAIWLKVLGVPYSGLWGLLAFFFNFIPNIGSVIAAVPAVLIAWLELTTLPAVAAAIGFVLVNTVIGNFVEPRLMGRGLGLSPLVVFCSMVFWGFVLGPIGMLLSVPLTMTARIGLDGFEDTRWVATLLGNAE